MANVTPTITTFESGRYQTTNWDGFAASGDVGLSYSTPEFPAFNDRSVQILGSFTGGLEISIEGSNDGGTTWAVLNDSFGTALVFTGAGIKAVAELTELIRPRATAGTGGASIDVKMFMKGVR